LSTQPQGTQPQGTQPQGTQPQGTQPQGTQPQGTQLQGTQPQGMQPQVTHLKACNHSTIQIFLYRKTFAISFLDISTNHVNQLSIDFIQPRELCLSNTELSLLSPSISYIEILKCIDILCNRRRDREHTKHDKMRNLGSLSTYNNHF
ncbi:hypothetical protein BC936DRAFT_141568, partial [Jimgerdemannia flammicorona]